MANWKRVGLLWLLTLTIFGGFSLAFKPLHDDSGEFTGLVAALPMISNILEEEVEPAGNGSPPYMLYLTVGGMSLALTLVLVPCCKWLALKLDIVDRPSAERKVHKGVIPYLGGLPFYVCFLVTILFIEFFFPQYSVPLLYPMCFVGTLIVLMGVYDDICDMPSLYKLILQITLGVVLYFWGFQATEIVTPLGGTFQLQWFAIVITPLWITGVINAINFSDGLDGLAAGLTFICAATLLAIGIKPNQVVSCAIMACLMGATLGFLRYNFNPASIFMGDAGALFLGFVLGTTTLIVRQKGVAIIALAVPMMVMAIPLVDTLLSFYRRLLRAREGQFFDPDRNHLHHRLLDLGLSQRQVVFSLYYISVCMGILAYVFTLLPFAYGSLLLLVAGMIIVFGVAVLRFIEGLSQRKPKG